MRVALLAETYSKNMGYVTNALPKALSRLGAEVHVLTSALPPYYNMPDFDKTYGNFVGAGTPPAFEDIDGYRVHYLRHQKLLGYLRLPSLSEKLESIDPDIVQAIATVGWIPLEAALHSFRFHKAFFTEAHTHASVFPLARRNPPLWDRERIKDHVTRAACGRLVSLLSEKCYATAADCADVAIRFFGVQKKKMEICHLGVDTEVFSPVNDNASNLSRIATREELGFTASEIVCIYTGRFTDDKNPLLLAQAVARLAAAGEPFRALFVGDGVQRDAIAASRGCVVRPFVPFQKLGRFFRAADIGVWPTQESMSMLDGAACGLPLIVNDTLQAVERIEGNGISYRLNDVNDLVRAIRDLRNPEFRARLGAFGERKMRERFSWAAIAKQRLADYAAAMRKTPSGLN